MEKIEYNLDNSGDGDHEILGVIDESSVGSGGDGLVSHTMLDGTDEEVQYAFRNADGTLTYRVVHVKSDDTMDPMMASSSSFPQNQQQVLGTPLNGQFYVIGNSSDMFSSQTRSLAPRGIDPSTRTVVAQGMKKRDDRRRATHNEVERRRRDKINNWIMKLSKIIPEGGPDGNKVGAFEGQSKGGILAKACEYITELRDSNQSLQECLKDNDKVVLELEMSRQQIDQLKRENDLLRSQLTQQGIATITHSES